MRGQDGWLNGWQHNFTVTFIAPRFYWADDERRATRVVEEEHDDGWSGSGWRMKILNGRVRVLCLWRVRHLAVCAFYVKISLQGYNYLYNKHVAYDLQWCFSSGEVELRTYILIVISSRAASVRFNRISRRVLCCVNFCTTNADALLQMHQRA